LESGLHLLPLIVSCSLAATGTGTFIQKTVIYLPVMYAAQVLLTLGVGLLMTLHFGQSVTRLVIFEVIIGLGVGMNIDPPLLSAQAATSVLDTAAVITTMNFIRSTATSIAIVLGGVLFQNQMDAVNAKLVRELGQEPASHFNDDQASASVDFILSLPPKQQIIVREAYFSVLKAVWVMVEYPSRSGRR
jgi:hypothetical protein